MDYRQKARLNQDKSMRIKHMAFAVKSVDKALLNFQSFLSVSPKTEKVIWEKAETKVAIFFINDIEFQLCESLKSKVDLQNGLKNMVKAYIIFVMRLTI
jgi:Ribonuclease G/E